MDSIRKAVSQGLRRARKKRRMSQEEVAKIIGTGANQISRYEQGAQDPSATRLIELAILYEYSLDEIIEMGQRTYEVQ